MRRRHVACVVEVSLMTVSLMFVSGLAGEATAQDAASDTTDDMKLDDRWTPWLRCWQLWEEQFEPGDELEDERSIVGRTSVCVTPAEAGISLTATAGEQLLVERRLVADGTQHEVDEDGCQGWERSDWSFDGQRLFTAAKLRCGDAPTRTVTGVSLMSSASSWVDIQFVQIGDREQLEVRRYSPMPDLEAQSVLGVGSLPLEPAEIRQARRVSAEALGLADVMEASERTTPRVVEALLVETEPYLDLDSASIIALDDAGIDDDVIDLVVALSYPGHFVVERRNRGGAWSSGGSHAYGGRGGFYDPIWYGDLYPYYVTPLGARSWYGGYNPYLYGAAASPFVILPGNGGRQESTGRAYAGRGYIRVRPREVSLPGQAGRRGGASSPGTRGTSGATSRGGTATSGGYTGGGGGTSSGGGSSSGRRAVPRSK